MNKIIYNLTIQNYRNFKYSFQNAKDTFWDDEKSKLIHPGEYGIYREELAKTWLRMFIPEQFEIGSGFLIDSSDNVSHQCDIIIYDKSRSPKIENIDKQMFFPIETVLAVGEIKSDINSIGILNKHLIKLSKVKEMRANIKSHDIYQRHSRGEYYPKQNMYDNLFTFIICNKLNFNFDIKNIDYAKVDPYCFHNTLLSLEDGVLNYRDANGQPNCNFPFAHGKPLDFHFMNNIDTEELPMPVASFLSSLLIALSGSTLLNVDMTHYLTDMHTGNK